MATYSTIKGFTIQSLASDPSAPGVAGATWASGADINTARQSVAAFGNPVATTAVIAGGTTGLLTEEYDGTSWAAVNTLTGSATNSAGSAGTVTAGVYFGGSFGPPGNTNITQKYDGTSWTTSGLMNTARRSMACGGTQTAAFAALGADVPTFVTAAETFDGSTWTSINSCLTARRSGAGSGTTTAALAFGGYTIPGAIADQTETYDGSSWSETNDLNTGRTSLAGSGAGTNTAALAMGGDTPPATAVTEYFDGTSWTEVADLSRARVAGGSGTSTDAFIAGGSPEPSPATYSSESEFFSTGTSIAQEGQVWYNTTSTVLKGFGMLGTGAWASGGDMNVGRSIGAGAGASQDAALAIGGTPDGISTVNAVESYNGTTWTEVADMLIPRRYLVGVGIQTAALACGGSPANSNVEKWDGSSWTEVNNLTRSTSPTNTTQYATGFGSSTSAIFSGGSEGGAQLDLCEQYDGTSWSEVADLNATRSYGMGAGTSGAAGLFTGGRVAGPTISATNEQWDGTSWTEVNNINTARNSGGASNQGTVTASLIFGGNTPPRSVVTEQWDGTSWTEVGDLATPVFYQQGAGVSGSALSIGGDDYPGANRKTTFEWTIPDAIKTFTAT